MKNEVVFRLECARNATPRKVLQTQVKVCYGRLGSPKIIAMYKQFRRRELRLEQSQELPKKMPGSQNNDVNKQLKKDKVIL